MKKIQNAFEKLSKRHYNFYKLYSYENLKKLIEEKKSLPKNLQIKSFT